MESIPAHCHLLLLLLLPVPMTLFKMGCKTHYVMFCIWRGTCLSLQNGNIDFSVSSRQEKKIFIVLSPCFFQPLLIKLEKNSVKKGDHSRCCPAQADVLNHKSLLEWKGHKEDAPKFLLLLTYLPCAPVLFKWCQLVYTAYCYGKYFFFLRLCLLGFSLFHLFLSKFKCNCI